MKQLLPYLSLVFFLSISVQAMSQAKLSPIAERISQAKEAKANFIQTPLFSSQAVAAVDGSDYLHNAVETGTLLQWDGARIAQAKSQNADYIEVSLPRAGAKPLELVLYKANFFTPEFRVVASDSPNEAQANVDGIHYWGIVKNQPGSLAAISIFEHEVMGIINQGHDRWVLGAIDKDKSGRHILYRTEDLRALPDFTCMTDDDEHYIGSTVKPGETEKDANNCVKMYIETDYDLFVNKGSVVNVTNYMTGVFSQVAILYANESINFLINELFVWSTVDPYTGTTTSNYLTQFRNAKNGVYNGNLAHLVGLNGGGGVAYLDVLCEAYYGVGYSAIQSTYNNVPTYSWTVEVLTHEIGHNLGSPHTHACSWNGNNTAIDGCGPTAGYSEGCTAAVPTQGTIMSYCHLVSGVGINFNLGFGPQPGDLIRNRVYNAACLTACDGGGGGGECTENAVTVSITLDNYPQETSWQITNSSGTVVASGGPYGGAGSTVTVAVCLPDGCYNFVMIDSYGDGICCSYGNGSYLVTDSEGNTLASGASFTSSEITNFCLPFAGGGGCTYSTINSNNFDSGWGIWADGGTDCARINNAAHASSGTYSIQLRDNTNTSVMTTSNQNLAAYSELTVTFSYKAVSFETNEDFWLQISTNGGTTYTTIADYNAGSSFVNGTRYNPSVVIPGPFTSTTRLRFRADASADDDVVYIDDVVITGCSGGALVGGLSQSGLVEDTDAFAPISLFPNPASDNITLSLNLDTEQEVLLVLSDITGKAVWTSRSTMGVGKQQLPISLNNLAPGAYQLSVLANGVRSTHKFVRM